MSYRVLMVCTGNICRSVMAQAVLDSALQRAGVVGVEVDSVGISGEEFGNPIDRRAANVLRTGGYPIPLHRTRQITLRDIADSTLILAMTSTHFNRVQCLATQAGIETHPGATGPGRTNLRMYRSFGTDPRISPHDTGEGDPFHCTMPPGDAAWYRRSELDVPDPWYGTKQDFVETLRTIEDATPALVEFVRNQISRAEM
ncbi:MAG: low molecular weight protein-tyrosine-phosphatase [Actinomycetaceae bacterium]|nr:low molecular weight protein-tyrosine-phosphatase [Actinomycetaceae bacterium]